MATNILIGVGGTGAKVVEAMLVMLAAGVGVKSHSDQVYVCLVDQDESNGNLARTRKLLNKIIDFQSRWSPNKPNGIAWGENNAPAFGRLQIRNLFLDGGPENLPLDFWQPNKTYNNLDEVLQSAQLPSEKKQLLHMLFQDSPEELSLDLRAGYRGRSHVGAAAIQASITAEGDRLISRINDLINGIGDNSQVNICLAGSSFGGTGAAGFPILARRIHELRKTKRQNGTTSGYKANVAIGGVLMLPYFSFAPPTEEERNTVVAPEDLMPKAKIALEYYEDLLKKEKPFDQFYILGWNRFVQFDYFEKGNTDQENPATLPELLAATAIAKFFTETTSFQTSQDASSADFGRPACNLMVSSRTNAHVTWQDLPNKELEVQFSQMLRFVSYWRYHVERELRKKPERLLGLIPTKRNWAQRISKVNELSSSEGDLQVLDELIDHILTWAATVQEKSGPEFGTDRKLWDLTKILDPTYERTPQKPVKLSRPQDVSNDWILSALDGVTRLRDGLPYPFTSATFAQLDVIDTVLLGANNKQLGLLLAAVYQSVGYRQEAN